MQLTFSHKCISVDVEKCLSAAADEVTVSSQSSCVSIFESLATCTSAPKFEKTIGSKAFVQKPSILLGGIEGFFLQKPFVS